MKKLMVFAFLLPLIANAQVDSTLQRRYDVVRLADGMAYTFTSPVRWQGKDWLTLGGVVAGTALVTLLDKPVRNFWESPDSKFLDGLERVGFHYGKPYSGIISSGGFYLVGLIIKDEWTRETGLMLATSFLTSGGIQTFMKTAVGRARPRAEFGVYAFDPFSDKAHYHSFPSGHQTVAFSTSMILASRVKSPALKVVFYSGAVITAFSRMYTDQHWFSDIAFGGTLAYFCAQTAMTRIGENKFRKPKTQHGMSWQVSPFPGGLTIRASIR